jgi:hypothetical protein
MFKIIFREAFDAFKLIFFPLLSSFFPLPVGTCMRAWLFYEPYPLALGYGFLVPPLSRHTNKK